MPGLQSFTHDERVIEDGLRRAEPFSLRKKEGTTAQCVLADVYEFLEDYAPTWYSDRLRGRILTALTASETKR